MYQRFLNNNDYLSIVTEEAMSQLIRGKEERLAMAEEAAEQSIIEYLTDNYEIEKTLAVGKNLREYTPQIIYPAGSHFYYMGAIYRAIRPIGGYKAPELTPYWQEVNDIVNTEDIKPYSQLLDYSPNDLVMVGDVCWKCLDYNGYSYGDIRYPGVCGWIEAQAENWEANVEYELWSPVRYRGKYYALTNLEAIDWTNNPEDSDNWGLIGQYDPDYTYEFSSTEYVEYRGTLFVPAMNVNADKLEDGYNISQADPRNGNVKKHMLRLAVYELHKLISPNNISSARITDYETSITWLRDASRLRINPNIPRKLDDENKPVAEFAIATFMRDYDPYKNPWQI